MCVVFVVLNGDEEECVTYFCGVGKKKRERERRKRGEEKKEEKRGKERTNIERDIFFFKIVDQGEKHVPLYFKFFYFYF